MTTTENDDDPTKAAVQLTIIIGVAALLLNVAFYFLAGIYYDGKMAGQGLLGTITNNTVTATRISFAVFTGSVAVLLVGAMFIPRYIGHGLAGVAGVASLIASISAFQAGMPNALSVALLVLAGLFPVLVWRSLLHSRAAWSFLVSLCWVLAVVLLFGAPKVRSKIDIGLWTAMIIPGVLFVAGVALVFVRREYRDFRDLR
jgi:hypothetical protein